MPVPCGLPEEGVPGVVEGNSDPLQVNGGG